MTKWSAIALFMTLLLAAAACTTTSNSAGQLSPIEADIATTTAPTTQPPSTEAEPTPARVDVDALLIQYGYERCGHNEPNDSLTDERREELFQTTSAAGLTNRANLAPGSRVYLNLHVLNEETLKTLATLAEPTEVCVDGLSPEEYVAPGPQPLGGPGWRWLGSVDVEVGDFWGLITTQAGYDAMWGTIAATADPLLGPVGDQPEVDFSHEAIVTIQTQGTGIGGGSCGVRLDAVNVVDGVIVIDWFRPGGNSICPANIRPGTYAIALDLDVVGPLPLRLALRRSPISTRGMSTSVKATDSVLLWPLVRLAKETFSHQHDDLQSSELANSIECRLFRGFSETEIVGGTDIPPDFLEASKRYVWSADSFQEPWTKASNAHRRKARGEKHQLGNHNDRWERLS